VFILKIYGILLKSDMHKLFDKGYLTITPRLNIEVSGRLRDEFENGRYYYPSQGKEFHHLTTNPLDHPSFEILIWYNEKVFRE
jgi:putative restriction endonuclease